MFAVTDILIFAVFAGAVAAGALALWPWARARGRFAVVGATAALGIIAWNLTLNVTNATGFDTDAPVVRISWQDAGSGILAFVTSALVLGLVLEREERASRIVSAAAIAGVVVTLLDIFAL